MPIPDPNPNPRFKFGLWHSWMTSLCRFGLDFLDGVATFPETVLESTVDGFEV